MHYHLSLELVAPDASQLPGQAEITFQLQSTQDPLVLDFRDGSATNLTINGADDDDGANGHLIIPGHNFTTGRNRIALDFVSGIATSGRAITRYLDRDQYIYSLFVPMDASRAFPCFDQPDLKARFDLDITAPDNWTVVSNTRIESTAPTKPGFRHTDFAETAPLRTFLFALAAGPFRAIPGEGFRLFVRQSKFDRAPPGSPRGSAHRARACGTWPSTSIFRRHGTCRRHLPARRIPVPIRPHRRRQDPARRPAAARNLVAWCSSRNPSRQSHPCSSNRPRRGRRSCKVESE